MGKINNRYNIITITTGNIISISITSTGSRCRPYNLKFSDLAQILGYDGLGED
jgi:hypothetical protein